MKERQPELPGMPPVDIVYRVEVTEMPDQETLQEFLRGLLGKPTVIFDSKKGKFIHLDDKA